MESNDMKQQKSRKKRKHKSRVRSKPMLHDQNSIYSVPLNIFSSDFLERSRFVLGTPDNPQCSWFWENYRKAMGWQERHQVAYWRSRALASEHQNTLLLNYVENNVDELHSEHHGELSVCGNEPQEDCRTVDASSDSESFVFEVNEEMLSFFEQSMKHKSELKKQREEEQRQLEKDDLDSISARQSLSTLLVGRLGIAEKTSLYGKSASTIVALETSMQLAFERYLDQNKPKLWPNIPLNL